MNKTALYTVLGAALLGLAKSKGSSARRMSLDDFFKKKVGNQDQTFKIHFGMRYAPFWDNHQISRIQYDFEEYVGNFLDLIHDVVNDFKTYLDEEYNEVPDDIDEIFSSWCYDNDVYWSDDLASDYMDFDSWAFLETLRSNSKFHLKFQRSVDAYDIQEEQIEYRLDEAKYLIDNQNIFEYDEDEYWVGNFLYKLQEEGEFEGLEWEDVDEFNALQHQIIEKKEELKELLTDWKDDGIFCPIDEWLFEWDEEVNGEAGYVTGVLEVTLNLETMNVSKSQWLNFIETVLHNAYSEWYREEKPRDTIGDAEVGDPQIDKVEPDIWAKKKSNLRKR